MKTSVRKWGNSRPLRVRKYSLNALLRKVSRRNQHAEVTTGKAVGREAW